MILMSWLTRYQKEVAVMTDKYEEINARSTTVTRKATPEEAQYYNSLLHPVKKNYLKEELHKRGVCI